jgi:cation-transporting ATPase E
LPVRGEVPFSSAWKWSALTFDGGPNTGTYVLGAPEVLQTAGTVAPEVATQISTWSVQGWRVLLFARAPRGATLDDQDQPCLPNGLTALGILSFRDELRPQARETLARFAAAGVQPKLISGDNADTVAALAAQAGLGSDIPAISGLELARMDETQRAEAIRRARIFGRVTPEQKEELITVLRQDGHYVAMIGDGVNDVMSLKRADIAIAMESGSQAARAVADIVLLGDSFEILPSAVEEGQRIQNGLRDILKLFLTRVLTVAILLIAVALLGGFAFDPKHISVLTTLTVGIPSIGLAAWARPGALRRGSVTRQILHFVLPASLTLALAGLATYLFVALTSTVDAFTRAQTALTVMAVPCGLLLLPFVEPPTRFWEGGDSVSGDWRPTILAGVLFAAFMALLAIRPLRSFFGLTLLSGVDYLVIASIVVVWAVVLRFTWRARLLDRFLGIDL